MLDTNSDMIPDSNISVESYYVCEWTAGYV